MSYGNVQPNQAPITKPVKTDNEWRKCVENAQFWVSYRRLYDDIYEVPYISH